MEARFERLLDYLFWCGMEVLMLSLPVVYLLLAVPYPVYASLSASVSLAVGTVVVAAVRGGYLGLDDDGWPGFGDLQSVPFRAAYYGLTVALGTFCGVEATLRAGDPLFGVLVPLVVVPLVLYALPGAFAATRRAAHLWRYVAGVGEPQ